MNFFAELKRFQEKISTARTAHAMHVEYLKQFQEFCVQGNWQAAEQARTGAIAAMEAYLDALKVLYMHKEEL